METIGIRIKNLRKKLNLTQQELGDIVGLHGTNIGRIESGQVLPSSDILLKMAIYFQVSCDYLLTGENCVIADRYDIVLLDLFHQLDDNEKQYFIEQLEFNLFKKKNNSNVKFSNSNQDNDN